MTKKVDIREVERKKRPDRLTATVIRGKKSLSKDGRLAKKKTIILKEGQGEKHERTIETRD